MATIKKFDIENATEADVAEWLTKFSDTELEKLVRGIAHEQVDRSERRIAAVKADVAASLEKQGLTLDQVFGHNGKRGPKPGGTIAPKYRNPKDGSQTWTGRGKRPNWLTAIVGDMDKVECDKYLASIEIK